MLVHVQFWTPSLVLFSVLPGVTTRFPTECYQKFSSGPACALCHSA